MPLLIQRSEQFKFNDLNIRSYYLKEHGQCLIARDVYKAVGYTREAGKKAIQNLVIFGDEVEVDLEISNPTLQARKKVEVAVMKAIHEFVHQKAKVKVTIKVDAPKKPEQNLIRGKKIEGIKHIKH